MSPVEIANDIAQGANGGSSDHMMHATGRAERQSEKARSLGAGVAMTTERWHSRSSQGLQVT